MKTDDKDNKGSSKLWGGRFSEATDAFVQRFTASVEFDQRLYNHDIDGSIAHAKMLHRVAILSTGELVLITDGLEAIRLEIQNGNFTWSNSTATTGNFTLNVENTASFIFTVNGTTWHPVIPDKNWMPYPYSEYEPKWHKKFARYKLQIEKMWD